MPRINLIKQFAFKCLNCNTCIRFEVPQPTVSDANVKLDELASIVNNLVCPKCNTQLGVGASKAFNEVKSINASASLLNISIENGTVEID